MRKPFTVSGKTASSEDPEIDALDLETEDETPLELPDHLKQHRDGIPERPLPPMPAARRPFSLR